MVYAEPLILALTCPPMDKNFRQCTIRCQRPHVKSAENLKSKGFSWHLHKLLITFTSNHLSIYIPFFPFRQLVSTIEWIIEGQASRGRMIWLLSHPFPPPSPVSKLDRRHTGRLRKRDKLLTGEGGRGAESYDGEKAWSSINHSLFSTFRLPELNQWRLQSSKCVSVYLPRWDE
jgi:hypothetical protein